MEESIYRVIIALLRATAVVSFLCAVVFVGAIDSEYTKECAVGLAVCAMSWTASVKILEYCYKYENEG